MHSNVKCQFEWVPDDRYFFRKDGINERIIFTRNLINCISIPVIFVIIFENLQVKNCILLHTHVN